MNVSISLQNVTNIWLIQRIPTSTGLPLFPYKIPLYFVCYLVPLTRKSEKFSFGGRGGVTGFMLIFSESALRNAISYHDSYADNLKKTFISPLEHV